MKADGSDFSKKQPTAATQEVAKKPNSFKEWLLSQTDSFKGMIPHNTINPERFIRAAAIEIVNNPRLMACSRESIVISLGQCARYGLEPGQLLGQAWLIPYNESRHIDNVWKKVPTCHFQIGYKGLITLARRSETIKTISAEVVYENDFFDVQLGVNRNIDHRINITQERGEPIAYYAVVELVNGGFQFAVMSKKDAENHRDRFSKAHAAKKEGKAEQSVWDTDFDSMSLKTVIIKCLKLCPISIEALEIVNKEEQRMAGIEVPDVPEEFKNDIPDADFTIEPVTQQPANQDVNKEQKQEAKPAAETETNTGSVEKELELASAKVDSYILVLPEAEREFYKAIQKQCNSMESFERLIEILQSVIRAKEKVKKEEAARQPQETPAEKKLIETETGHCYVEDPFIEQIIANRKLTIEEKSQIYSNINQFKGIDQKKYDECIQELQRQSAELSTEIVKADSYIRSLPVEEREYWENRKQRSRTLKEYQTLNSLLANTLKNIVKHNSSVKTPPPPPLSKTRGRPKGVTQQEGNLKSSVSGSTNNDELDIY